MHLVERLAAATGRWPFNIECDVPEGFDLSGAYRKTSFDDVHYGRLMTLLDPTITDPDDFSLGFQGLGQVSEEEGVPTMYGPAIGYSGPAIAERRDGSYIYAPENSLEIAVPDVPGSVRDEQAEAEYNRRLGEICERWVALINEHAPKGGPAWERRIKEGWAQRMRFFKRELLGPNADLFIETHKKPLAER